MFKKDLETLVFDALLGAKELVEALLASAALLEQAYKQGYDEGFEEGYDKCVDDYDI
jgi:flagellar biosynthesis/type III secretory pathway protein FliH